MYRRYSIDNTEYLEIGSSRDLDMYISSVKDTRTSFTFNGIVAIREGTVSAARLFNNCTKFNSPIHIPYGVLSCELMLQNCQCYNFPIFLPDSVTNCRGMLWDCQKYNQPIELPNSIISCMQLLWNCYRYDQPLVIPRGVHGDIRGILHGCFSMQSPVIFLAEELAYNDPCVADLLNMCDSVQYKLRPSQIYLANRALSEY